VVGVVGDVVPGHSLTATTWPSMQVYVPYGLSPTSRMTLVARTVGGPEDLIPAIREQLHAVDPSVAITSVQTLDQAIEEVHWVSGFFSRLFTFYAAIALAIASLGAYGLTADSVARRFHEMGVRVALGARPADLLRMVVGKSLMPAALGVALGLLGAVAVTRLMSSMLYEVSATDPTIFGGVALLLSSIAIAAAYPPARRASRVDVCEALRFE